MFHNKKFDVQKVHSPLHIAANCSRIGSVGLICVACDQHLCCITKEFYGKINGQTVTSIVYKYEVITCFQVLITDPEKLEGIRQRESDITKEKIQKILAAGANVVLCSGGIDDLCLKVI